MHPGGADHGIACDQLGELFFVHVLCPGGAFWHNKVTNFGCRVPNTYLDGFRQIESEFAQDGARLDDGT